MLFNVSQEERVPPTSPLTPDEAKAKVLDHWHQLDALARRCFPKDQNLAHEGLLYVLKHLEAARVGWGEWNEPQHLAAVGMMLGFLRHPNMSWRLTRRPRK